MKQLKFWATSTVVLSMLTLLISCGSGGDKKTTEAAVDSPAAKPVDTTAAVPAKPGNVAIIIHKVANYAKWKPGYDADDSARLANGLHNYVIGRGMDDSNMVVVILKMDDLDKAKAMSTSPGLKAAMQKAGVIGKPTISFQDVVMNDNTPIDQTARVRVTHKVKDWDAWKKVFDSHKQARMDAGLIDRGVSYSIGDNHSVSLVFAITDMAKAKAFMNSKDLKDKMAEGGVEGAPSFFFYNIVQKY
jgi:hypothetical protein